MSAAVLRSGYGLLLASAGWFVWGACLVILYVVQALGCHTSLRIPDVLGMNGLSVALATIWAAHVAALLGLEWHAVRRFRRIVAPPDSDTFLQRLTRVVNLTAFGGVIWIGSPVLLLPPCA